MNRDTTASKQWDKEYENGRYENESQIKFIYKIIKTLEKSQKHFKGNGLYVGCGNGRNYIPLVRSTLNILGIDISKVAIRQLEEKIPELSDKLQCIDFAEYNSVEPFDYIVSIQIFQHGTEKQIKRYFENTLQLLKPGGLLFLRVNSTSTDISFKHMVTETNHHGGFTIQYMDGPKKDLYIHFYSLQELNKLCSDFDCIIPPYEDTTKRIPPKTGSWSQWELILRKK